LLILTSFTVKIYKNYFSKVAKQCAGHPEKSACMHKARMDAYNNRIKELEKGNAQCAKSKDPIDCKVQLMYKIKKIKAKLQESNYTPQLGEYLDEETQLATQAHTLDNTSHSPSMLDKMKDMMHKTGDAASKFYHKNDIPEKMIARPSEFVRNHNLDPHPLMTAAQKAHHENALFEEEAHHGLLDTAKSYIMNKVAASNASHQTSNTGAGNMLKNALMKKAAQSASANKFSLGGMAKNLQNRGNIDESFMFENEDTPYQQFFKEKLAKYGVESEADLSEDKKKEFFDEIEKEWTKDKI
jgi:hypothetical protein